MDCFLATSLGRPNHVSCETASELCPTPYQTSSRFISSARSDLCFAVNASKIVGEILSQVYHKRKASRSVAYQLSLRFSDWLQQLPPDLHWRALSFQNPDPALTLKRLHINLISFHGIIILTRPFFLHQIGKQDAELERESTSSKNHHKAYGSRTEKQHAEETFSFDRACVRAALHSITAVNNAFTTDALPRRNPFVMYVNHLFNSFFLSEITIYSYWLFSAALIVLANLFSPVYCEADSESAVRMALKVMRFCGQTDPQARRYQNILESFFEALRDAENAKDQAINKTPQTSDIFSMFFGNQPFDIGGSDFTVQTQNRMSAASMAPMAWTDDQIPPPNTMSGLGKSSFISGINEMAGEHSSSIDIANGQCSDSVDNNDIWWSGGQDLFTNAGEIQVPLYGLMESPL